MENKNDQLSRKLGSLKGKIRYFYPYFNCFEGLSIGDSLADELDDLELLNENQMWSDSEREKFQVNKN
jgi:hypothetical protein